MHRIANLSALQWASVLSQTRSAIEKQLPREMSELSHFSAADRYTEGYWNKTYGVDGYLPALVHNYVGNWAELGNYLGIYLDTISCSHLTGMHYLAVSTFWYRQGVAQSNMSSSLEELLYLMPMTIVSEPARLPPTRQEALRRIDAYCPCRLFCWAHAKSAWARSVDYFGPLLRKALRGYLAKHPYDENAAIREQRLVQSSSTAVPTRLPLIPSVTIHYRCSDTLRSEEYGFLPYEAFDSILPRPDPTIPGSRKPANDVIYIISDHPDRGEFKEECRVILDGLREHVSSLRPDADVILKRGDPIIHDLARIAFSNVTVCSGSTFCLWPAMSATGLVYMPLNPPVAGARGALRSHDRFRWITRCQMLHFSSGENITEIVKKMKAKCQPLPPDVIESLKGIEEKAVKFRDQHKDLVAG